MRSEQSDSTKSRAGLHQLIDSWQQHTDAFFSMLSLEIWGRLFFRGEDLESLSQRLAGAEHAQLKRGSCR